MQLKKEKKDYLTPSLLIILIGLVAWMLYQNSKPVEPPKPVVINIPEQKGSTGTQVREEVKVVTVPIPGDTEVIVDEKWYKEYLEAKDSLERLNKYVQAIQIRTLDTVFVDNDTIKLSGELTTRGSLLSYRFDYDIKERRFEYTPEVVSQRPKFSVSLEASAGVPTVPTSGFLMKGQIGLENRRGNALTVGYDTEQRVWLGIRKNLTVIK